MSRFLLIHGAWHGAWVWDAVLPFLDRYDVAAPDLPGCGVDSTSLSPDIGLARHVEAAMPGQPAIICAHSYGGIVARVIADRRPDLVAGLVLVEALWPENGQTALGLLSEEVRRNMESAIAERGEGWRIPVPDSNRFDLPDPKLVEEINRMLTDHPAKTFRDAVTVGASGPTGTYLVSTDRDPQPYTATVECLKRRGWTIVETSGGHELPLTQPALVAGLCLAAASKEKASCAKK